MSARHIENKVLTSTMSNIIDHGGVSQLTNSIDQLQPSLNVKFADLAMLLSGSIKIFNYCIAFS